MTDWVVRIIIIIVFLAIADSIFLLQKYLRLVINLFLSVQMAGRPENAKHIGEPVDFKSRDGIALKGMFLCPTPAEFPSQYPARNRIDELSNKTIIFCHEFGSDKNSALKYCGYLLDAGFNIFAFDFRGQGESENYDGYEPKQWVTSHEVNDLLGAIDYVKSRSNGKEQRVALFGMSKGANACICTGAESEDVAVVVADGSFSTKMTLEAYMRRWVSIFANVRLIYENLPDWVFRMLRYLTIKICELRFNYKFPDVEEKIAEIAPRPVLIIHGERDNYIRIDQANMLFEKASEPKQFWIVPKARHNEGIIVEPDNYKKVVTEFLQKNLTSGDYNATRNQPYIESPIDVHNH